MVKWLYNDYALKLHRYSKKVYVLNEDDSWNLVYKTIYKIADCGKDYTFDRIEKLNGFIFRTHINFLRNFFRDNKNFENSFNEVDLEENIEENIETQTSSPLRILLDQELEQLEGWQRILLLMRAQGASYHSIAEFTGKPEKHLKVYYSRLKKQITEKLNNKLNQQEKGGAQ